MKIFIFLLCLAGTTFAGVLDGQLSLQPEYYMLAAKERLAVNMQRVCEDKSETEIEEAINKLIECSGEIEIESHTICHLLQAEVPRCVRHISDFMEDCLPERSVGLPNLVISSLNATTNYMCGTDGEHLLELVANPCIYNRFSYKFNRCKNRIISKLQRYRDQTPTTEEICDALTSLKPCLYTHVEESCGNKITREAYEQLYSAALKPCAQVSNDIEEVEEVEIVYRK